MTPSLSLSRALRGCGSLLAIVVLLASAAPALAALIDVNESGSSTQSGWTAADASNINNVTFAAVGSVTVDDRVRTTNGGGAEADMWEDFIFANGSNLTSEGLDISVSGLLANTTYDVTIWAFDDGSNGGRSADWTGSNGGTSATLTFPDGPAPVDLNDYRIDITAITDGAGVFTLEGRTSASGPVGTHNVFINGFEYSTVAVPEPTSALLVVISLFGFGLAAWRRKGRIGS